MRLRVEAKLTWLKPRRRAGCYPRPLCIRGADLTKVTIIIHEGSGGRPHGRRAFDAQPGSEMGRRRHGRHAGDVGMGGECGCGHRRRHGHGTFDVQLGGEMERGRHGRHGHHGHHATDAQPRGERGFGRRGRHGERGDMGGRPFAGHHRPDHALSEAELAQRQLARQVRREVRRVLREAEAAGLNPERAARVARRETRRDDYL